MNPTLTKITLGKSLKHLGTVWKVYAEATQQMRMTGEEEPQNNAGMNWNTE